MGFEPLSGIQTAVCTHSSTPPPGVLNHLATAAVNTNTHFYPTRMHKG